MKLYKYKNYEHYKRVQEKGNIKKINNVWVSDDVVDSISDYIKLNIKNPSFGICHGTRGGVEQKLFMDNLNINVIGTEISSTAVNFPNTIQWDFHNIKDEWINNVDFIYTNAIDHSYDPELAIKQWMKCLSDKGFCFIEHTKYHERFSKLDCFSANGSELESLLSKFGIIVDIIKVNRKSCKKTGVVNNRRRYQIFVIKKFQKNNKDNTYADEKT